jgi:hypothetical protein
MKPHIITLITLGVDDVAAQELEADSGLHSAVCTCGKWRSTLASTTWPEAKGES